MLLGMTASGMLAHAMHGLEEGQLVLILGSLALLSASAAPVRTVITGRAGNAA
jgi:hypothetical protein